MRGGGVFPAHAAACADGYEGTRVFWGKSLICLPYRLMSSLNWTYSPREISSYSYAWSDGRGYA